MMFRRLLKSRSNRDYSFRQRNIVAIRQLEGWKKGSGLKLKDHVPKLGREWGAPAVVAQCND